MKCFYSLIDGLFFRLSGAMEVRRYLSVYCGSTEGKMTCGTRKCHCKREKATKNQLLRVWEEEKAASDPKMQKKRVWKIDFHAPDPSRTKTSLYNVEKTCYCGSERKKKPRQTRTLLCRERKPQKYLKSGFVRAFYLWST